MVSLNAKFRKQEQALDLTQLPVNIASATVIGVGDPISYESGLATLLATVTDDATFIGFSLGASKVGEVAPLIVQQKAIVEVTVDSAAYTLGQAIAVNAAGTAYEGTAANTVMFSAEDTAGVSVTTLKCLVDVVALGKLYLVGA